MTIEGQRKLYAGRAALRTERQFLPKYLSASNRYEEVRHITLMIPADGERASQSSRSTLSQICHRHFDLVKRCFNPVGCLRLSAIANDSRGDADGDAVVRHG